MNDELDDMQGFDEVEALLLETDADDTALFEPPADIWTAIEASIATPAATADANSDASVVQLASWRRSRVWLAAAAAATVLVAAGAVTLNATRSDSGSEILAKAELTWDSATFDPIGADATATAELISDESGYAIDFERMRLPETLSNGEELELWLIQPDAENDPAALVSLGTIDAASTTIFDVPDGFDPDDYFVVDISVEPADGNPAHSGRSILRGPLVQA